MGDSYAHRRRVARGSGKIAAGTGGRPSLHEDEEIDRIIGEALSRMAHREDLEHILRGTTGRRDRSDER
jgi:hypothetical protein